MQCNSTSSTLTAVFHTNLYQPVFSGPHLLSIPDRNIWHKWQSIFMEWMPFLSPNQQCQITQGL